MMNKLEEAIVYATIMHQGKVRRLNGAPFILHSLEVAQIVSTITDDQDVLCASILHDIVDDTDGTLAEIERRFEERVALLVSSVSEVRSPGDTVEGSWRKRAEESLEVLRGSRDQGVRILWLADALANVRALTRGYSERGVGVWESLAQHDPVQHRWYLRSIAEELELTLNRTGAFKELVRHVNSIWPGTLDSEKARFRDYREVSVEGCKVIGCGTKGTVYQYDEELVVKVYNERNTYRDVEREIALSREAFLRGIPTAISFGIVSVGNRYGAMYELVRSRTMSEGIVLDPDRAGDYAKMLAALAHAVHDVEVERSDGFPIALERVAIDIEEGIAQEDAELAQRCRKLLGTLIAATTLTHGDLHTGNVVLLDGEPLLIDMGNLAVGHPMIDISDLYFFYVALGEEDPQVIEGYMGFSCEFARRFFRLFLGHYLETEDDEVIDDVAQKASIIAYSRLIRRIHEKTVVDEGDLRLIGRCVDRIREVCDSVDTLDF